MAVTDTSDRIAISIMLAVIKAATHRTPAIVRFGAFEGHRDGVVADVFQRRQEPGLEWLPGAEKKAPAHRADDNERQDPQERQAQDRIDAGCSLHYPGQYGQTEHRHQAG